MSTKIKVTGTAYLNKKVGSGYLRIGKLQRGEFTIKDGLHVLGDYRVLEEKPTSTVVEPTSTVVESLVQDKTCSTRSKRKCSNVSIHKEKQV